jgi:hypothetical protein
MTAAGRAAPIRTVADSSVNHISGLILNRAGNHYCRASIDSHGGDL